MARAGCVGCGTSAPEGGQYCPECGLPGAGPLLLLTVLPAVATGGLVAVSGTAGLHLVPFSSDDGMIAEALHALFVANGVSLFAFIGGFLTVAVLRARPPLASLVAAAAVAALYPAAVFLLYRADVDAAIYAELGGIALLGGLAAFIAAGWLGRLTPFGRWADRPAGQRHLIAGLLTLASVAAAMVAVGVAIAALIIGAILLFIYASIQGMRGRTRAPVRWRWHDPATIDGKQVARSRDEETLFGRIRAHYNRHGEQIGTSERTHGAFEEHALHRNRLGDVVGTSHHSEGLLANGTMHRDRQGRIVGETRSDGDSTSNKAMEWDTKGRVVSESAKSGTTVTRRHTREATDE